MLNIDIVLMVGGKSGLEVALNRTADYLSDHGIHTRFIQIVSTNYSWHTKTADFIDLGFDRNLIFQETIEAYATVLRAGSPNLVLVTGMPEVLYIAKGALTDCSLPVPVIAWFQNDLSYYGISSDQGIDIFSYSDIVFATNDQMANSIQDNFPSKNIYRVFNPINPKNICFSIDRNTNKIAYIGRLSPEKNVKLILEALSLSQSYLELTIIGEGSEKPFLESLCEKYKLSSRVHFNGWTDTPWNLVSDHRALIVSSIDHFEGGPMTAIEALSCGMPVISTPVGFIPEIISNGKNVLLYDFDAPTELASILDTVITQSITENDANFCRDSVVEYRPGIALWDFLCKVTASAKLVGLPQRHWEDKETRIVKYKASVLISDLGKDDKLFIDQLTSLASQTIETIYYEIIVVHTQERNTLDSFLHEYEAKYSDIVLLVECDDLSSNKEAYEIASSYASGDMVFSFENYSKVPEKGFIEELYLKHLCHEE
jgi:glycosyltransferase involved in cell wall biosynthesis